MLLHEIYQFQRDPTRMSKVIDLSNILYIGKTEKQNFTQSFEPSKQKPFYMGQFVPGGNFGRLVSFLKKKVEPPCDQI